MDREYELASLHRQLKNYRKHLLLVQEEMSHYVERPPLDLRKRERELQEEVDNLRRQIAELSMAPAQQATLPPQAAPLRTPEPEPQPAPAPQPQPQPPTQPKAKPRQRIRTLAFFVMLSIIVLVAALLIVNEMRDTPGGATTPGSSAGAGADITSTPTDTPQPTATPGPLMAEIAPGVTMEFVEVPAGPFLMGSSEDDPNADDDEQPQHELTLPTYWIGRTEVTNAQFRPFVEGDGYTNPAYWSEDGWAWREERDRTQPRYWDDSEWNGDEQPVNGVTWYEAMAYAAWLSAQTGEDYRLPSEAEWEKAACGTGERIYPWGNETPNEERTNSDRNVGRTVPVGSYPAGASPYGALDMAGNVWEWTRSAYRDYPYDANDGREDISDPAGKLFTLRGGSWWSDETYVRCAARLRNDPSSRLAYDLGSLRVLFSPRVPSP
jgi:formylglycine-generating enzyme required for sulfatase activity